MRKVSSWAKVYVCMICMICIGCKDGEKAIKKDKNLFRNYFYIPQIHNNPAIWHADSLALSDYRLHAINEFQKIMNDSLSNDELLYVKCNLLCLQLENLFLDKELLQNIEKQEFEDKSLNYFKRRAQFNIAKYNNYNHYNISDFKENITDILPKYYEVQRLNLCGEYYLYNSLTEDAEKFLTDAEHILSTFDQMTLEHYHNFRNIAKYYQFNRDFDFGYLYLSKCLDFNQYVFVPNDDLKFKIYNDLLLHSLFTNNMVEAGRFLNISSQFFKDTCNLSGQMHLFGKQFYFFKTHDTFNLKYMQNAYVKTTNCHEKIIINELFQGIKAESEQNWSSSLHYFELVANYNLHGLLELDMLYSASKNLLIGSLVQQSNFKQAIQIALRKPGQAELFSIDDFIEKNTNNTSLGFIDIYAVADLYFELYKKNKNQGDLETAEKLIVASTSLVDDGLSDKFEKARLRLNYDIVDQINQLQLKVLYEKWLVSGENRDKENYVYISLSKRNLLLNRDFSLKNQKDPLWSEETSLRKELKFLELNGQIHLSEYKALLEKYRNVYQKIQTNSELRSEKPRSIKSPKVVLRKNESILILDYLDDQSIVTIMNYDTVLLYGIPFAKSLEDKIIAYSTYDGSYISRSMDSIKSEVLASIFPDKIRNHLNEVAYVYSSGIFNLLDLKSLLYGTDTHEKEHKYIYKYSSNIATEEKAHSEYKIEVFAFSDEDDLRNEIGGGRFTELSGSLQEALIIKEYFKDADIFVGKQANLKKFEEAYNSGKYQLIHIALHGVAEDQIIDNVKLYFKNPVKGIDSLYGFDLLDFPIQNTNVVLSSCQSAGGKNLNFEGPFSLARYFIANGAPNVCAAYHKVDDRISSQYFKYFYLYLHQNPNDFKGAYFSARNQTNGVNNIPIEAIPFKLFGR
ncbi:MAG: CHAT domain-containing protein [Lewinellaceae bacterium]|nr:CHAT domain-containing protein [Lewinellaceae bacterium]